MADKAQTPPATGPQTELDRSDEPSFSVFTVWEKRWILFLAAFASMFSPMSSFIFYPAITSMADNLGVTVGMVHLAITTYMIVSGVVPALLGNAADKFGRRPVYLLAMVIYFVANLGLSLQDTYAGLLVLRMLQSAGSSGTISLGYGVISDITTRADRGSYVGILLIGPNVATPTGPVIGGVLAAKLGWKWIFWFLCILGGACLLLILFALPETGRAVVGNGRVPPKGIYKTFYSVLSRHNKSDQVTEDEVAEPESKKLQFPNPIDCFRLLLVKDVAVVLLCNGIYYMIYCCVQASLSSLFIEVYGYNGLEAGLIYLPFGVACLISTALWGKVLDWDFCRTAKHHCVEVDVARAQDDPTFPIALARLRSSLYLVAVSTIAVIGYGWSIQQRTHAAVLLVMQAFIGFTGTGLFVAFGTLLTDLNPDRSSTAAASANLVRCGLAAAALAVLQIMIDEIGPGWTFTVFGVMSGLCGPVLIWLMRPGFRSARIGASQESTQAT